MAYYIRNPRCFYAIIKNFRWTRTLHYLLLFMAGMMFIYHHPPVPDPSLEGQFGYLTTIWKHPIDLFGIFMAALSLFLSFQSAVIFNDIFDYEIDVVSNPNRPLVTKAISFSEFRLVGRIFVILALTIAFCISETFFFFILLYHLFSFLYSAPPFRLRRYLLISNLELATIFILTFHAGTVALVTNYQFENVPPYITFGLLLSYALALTVKDAKDYEGDKQLQVQTVYTLFGMKTGNILTVVFVCSAILLTPLLLHLLHLLLFSAIICAIFLLVIMMVKNRKLKEGLIISLYYLYSFVLYFFLIFYHFPDSCP